MQLIFTYYVHVVGHLYPLINVILTYYKARTIIFPVLQKRLFSLLNMIYYMVHFFLSFLFYWSIFYWNMLFYFIGVQLIYNVVLISTTQQTDLVIHIQAYSFSYSFPSWFISGYWILFPVLYSRILLLIHSLYNSFHLITGNSQFIHFSSSFSLATTSLFYLIVGLFIFCK